MRLAANPAPNADTPERTRFLLHKGRDGGAENEFCMIIFHPFLYVFYYRARSYILCTSYYIVTDVNALLHCHGYARHLFQKVPRSRS